MPFSGFNKASSSRSTGNNEKYRQKPLVVVENSEKQSQHILLKISPPARVDTMHRIDTETGGADLLSTPSVTVKEVQGINSCSDKALCVK